MLDCFPAYVPSLYGSHTPPHPQHPQDVESLDLGATFALNQWWLER